MAVSRAAWRGFLKLSLVSCPIRMMPAVSRSERVRFHNLNPATHNRVEMRPHDSETGEELQDEDLVLGYEVDKGRFVLVEDEEIEARQLETSHTIDLDRFVARRDVDTLYLDSPYLIAPDGKPADETFRVIREALDREERVGIGRVILSRRERLVALQPRGKGMMVTTLRAADEVRKAAEYFADIDRKEPDAAKVELAAEIVDRKTAPFDPAALEDRFETALRALVEAKIKGEKPVTPRAPREAPVIDLMAALKRSLQAEAVKPPAKAGTAQRRPAGRAGKTREKARKRA